MNKRLFVGADASFAQRLYVVSDVSLNERLFVGGDSVIGGDISMNNRLFVGRDACFNGNLTLFNSNIPSSTSYYLSTYYNHQIIGNTLFYDNVTINQILTVAGSSVTSDERVKQFIKPIDNELALQYIRSINPINYTLIDDKTQSNTFGFSAQNVNSNIQNCVHKITDYIPNIYDNATIDETDHTILCLINKSFNDISLCNDSPYIKVTISNKDTYKIINKIIDDRRFSVTEPIDISGDNIFIYGQEVSDKLSVNYNSVFTILTSAVKEIDKELQETKKELADWKDVVQKQQDTIQYLLEFLKLA